METTHTLNYTVCRTISAPEDERAGRRVYMGQAPASSFVQFAGAPKQGGERSTRHLGIAHSLENRPSDFGVLHAGIVITAGAATVDDKARLLVLDHARVIDGNLTLEVFHEHFERLGTGASDPNIKFEVIVHPDVHLGGEVADARRAHMDPPRNPDSAALAELRALVAEDSVVQPDTLLSALLALMPPDLLDYLDEGRSKAFVFGEQARCRALLRRINEKKTGAAVEAHGYFRGAARIAWHRYRAWKTDERLLRAIAGERVEGRPEVPDGVVFPLLSADAEFMKNTDGRWTLSVPTSFDPADVIGPAAALFSAVAGKNPEVMGRSSVCYAMLARIGFMYAKLTA